MDILDLITNQLGDSSIVNKLGQSVNADPEKVQQLTKLGLPTIIEALTRNASTSEGAKALAGALDQHQDDNTDDLNDFLDKVDKNDGAKMLQHIFSDKTDRVQNNLASQTGLDASQVSGLLAQMAPLILGALGNQKKAQNIDAAGVSGLTSSLTSMLGQSGGGNLMGLASKFLDADNDGSIVDDIGSILGGFFGKKK